MTTLIAVLGTLLGTAMAYLLQQRGARTERVAVRSEDRRRERLTAVTDLVSALAAHRRAMRVREDLRLAGDQDGYAAARAESHATRAAITAPLMLVTVLAPDLADAASGAASATYALRGAADAAALTALRRAAIAATDRLVTAASASPLT
ncbi:hypothetical protein SZN_34477 [Streptomyces zinciresistens K42]|uniref:Protein kilB n=1 Tax=Streptomyces zinciresistens K42 TaxID=700597 RepID=G2GMZ0_9ACTN|nr:hypothetical protein SZN_34477 [Streptomyces zinciresistens K42]